MEVLQHAIREAGLGEVSCHVLRDGGRLGGGLQDDRVSSQDGRDQGIDQDQIGVLDMKQDS